MANDRFLIAPMEEGLQTDLRPWQTPENSFQEMNNAYVFRGRIRKRFGSRYTGTDDLTSRLAINLGLQTGVDTWAGNVPLLAGTWARGQAFSVNNVRFYVYQIGGALQMYRDDGLANVATYDTTTGAYNINIPGSGAGDVLYFYPALPVMGLAQYNISSINNQPAFAFDTQFAYRYATGWVRLGTYQWHGADNNFFWCENWTGLNNTKLLFATNFYAANPNGAVIATDDSIQYWSDAGGAWVAFEPAFLPAGGPQADAKYVSTAKIIVAFRNRLLLLNTIEATETAPGSGIWNNLAYVNRCRYSHNGSPLARNAWYEPNQFDNDAGLPAPATNRADGGGYIDAPTDEAIISAEFIKDRLIVYFERSTWELAYTGNQVLPFIWQKLNTELGSQSTYSTVPFDKFVLTIGQSGIHSCNGSNVERIDVKIPDDVFNISAEPTNVDRVHGIRDYFTEMVYWTVPPVNAEPDIVYPTRILSYNYKNSTWAYNDDCITTFGYFEQQTGATWADINIPWSAWADPWETGNDSSNFRTVIAGNPEGFVYILDADVSKNEATWQLTDFIDYGGGQIDLRIINASLSVGDWVKIYDPRDDTGFNEEIFQITIADQVNDLYRINSFPMLPLAPYVGGGFIARVPQIYIKSKQWNPYVKDGRDFQLMRIDFAVARTAAGSIAIDYAANASNLSLVADASASGAAIGTNILETSPYALKPLEARSDTLWHTLYFQAEGQFIQLSLYFNNDQMADALASEAPFELQGLILHTRPTSQILE